MQPKLSTRQLSLCPPSLYYLIWPWRLLFLKLIYRVCSSKLESLKIKFPDCLMLPSSSSVHPAVQPLAWDRTEGGRWALCTSWEKVCSGLRDAGETPKNQVQEWNLPYHFFSMLYWKERRSNFLPCFVFLSEITVCNPRFVKPVYSPYSLQGIPLL